MKYVINRSDIVFFGGRCWLLNPKFAVLSAGLFLTTLCAVLLTPPIRPTKDQQPEFAPVMWT